MYTPVPTIDALRIGTKHTPVEMSAGRPTDVHATQMDMFGDAPTALLSCTVAADPLEVHCPTCKRSTRRARAGQRILCTGTAFGTIR